LLKGFEGVTRGLILVGVLAGLAACGGVRPQAPGPGAPPTLTAQAGSPTLGVPGPVAPAPSGAIPTAFGSAALNSRLLSQVSAPTADSDLPIGPGDLIEVSVFEVEELSKLRLRVPLRGNVTLPLLGSIPAAGKTPIELEDEIRARLQQRYMHNPQVSVFVHEHQSQRITVIGAVRKGGTYTLTGRLRLADALAMAEGLTDEADHVIYLIRRLPAGTVARAQGGAATARSSVPPLPGAATEDVMAAIDLEALAAGRDELNVGLEAGDVIHVPRAGSYYVGGSVERPGSFFLKAKITVQQAIVAAGGVKDVADWQDVRLYRAKADGQREVLTLSLTSFEKGQSAPELQKNDVVIVGKSAGKAFWYGFVDFFKGVFGLSRGL
jgi:polysaccharide export outer membrane protein